MTLILNLMYKVKVQMSRMSVELVMAMLLGLVLILIEEEALLEEE
jgi:hypothetical protein